MANVTMLRGRHSQGIKGGFTVTVESSNVCLWQR